MSPLQSLLMLPNGHVLMLLIFRRYLAVDTQLFVVLPWLVLIAFWNRWAGIAVCVALWVGTTTDHTSWRIFGSTSSRVSQPLL